MSKKEKQQSAKQAEPKPVSQKEFETKLKQADQQNENR